jgi:hypothetical protein
VRTGNRFTKRLDRRLHAGRGFRLGPDTWYVIANGPSAGLLQVNRGIIRAVGIADKRFMTSRRATVRFLNVFR